MSWVRLDDHFPTHPKVIAVGGDAGWLHVCGLCYCAEHLTDGAIPKAVVPRLSDRENPQQLAEKLVEADVWTDDGDQYIIHDFLLYNRSREDVELERAAARLRRRNGAQASRDAQENKGGESSDVRANEVCPDPTRPEVPAEPLGAAAPSKRGTRIPDEFIVSEEMQDWARKECPDIDWGIHTKRFVAYWKGESGQRATKRNWNQAWRTWLLKEQANAKTRGPARTHL